MKMTQLPQSRDLLKQPLSADSLPKRPSSSCIAEAIIAELRMDKGDQVFHPHREKTEFRGP
ncbi:MAG TPA: hypothetical protein VJ124_19880 [Pyrinomonadaceae bacterium]|nr:hypothetical protein [Pyrinomonadaceae bacterium]